MRSIFHVDMDAFFAAVEQQDNPDCIGKPLIVGSDPMEGRGRGVVSTASYEARKFGIRSAMPISKAYQLCPRAVFVRPRMNRYAEISEGVFSIFNRYTSCVEEVGIDEGFLDCTGSIRLFGSPRDIALKIQRDIHDTFSLTASIGIAPNKSVAKIASDMNKPNGITICEAGREKEFLAPLPIGKLWGVGKKTQESLYSIGIRTIGDLASLDKGLARSILGKHGEALRLLALGVDDRPVVPLPADRKSVSEEHTFFRDTDDESALSAVLLRMCDAVSSRLRSMCMKARTVSIKIRLEGFETYTRQTTVAEPFYDMMTIKEESQRLLSEFDRNMKKVRLIGVGVAGLVHADHFEEQGLLFCVEKKSARSDLLLDELRARFGKKVSRASLLQKKDDWTDD